MVKRLDLCSGFQLKKCSKGNQPQDYTSLLPDDILLVILSLLTYKEAAQMSILSRRWFNLWMHFPALLLYAPVGLDRDMWEYHKFVNKVNRVLRCHKAQNLKVFRVTCELDKYYQTDIDSWLDYALTRKVQNLEFNFLSEGLHVDCGRDNYVFAHRLLNFSSKISRGGLHSDSNRFHSLRNFESLMSVSLKRVWVSEEALEFLLLNCQSLERLEVVGSGGLVNLIISDPPVVLKHLVIESCDELKMIRISNSKLVFLKIQTVPNLILINVPMLVELFMPEACWLLHNFSQISCCHSQLEVLTLHVIRLREITQLSAVAHLNKLKRLVISFGARRDNSLATLVSFLSKACPNLEELVLLLVWHFEPHRSNRCLGSMVKSCPLERLKVVEIMGYYGRVSDVELIMDLMENAASLEKVIVDPCNPMNESRYISEEHVARSIALQQFESIKESIPPRVELVVRYPYLFVSLFPFWYEIADSISVYRYDDFQYLLCND